MIDVQITALLQQLGQSPSPEEAADITWLAIMLGNAGFDRPVDDTTSREPEVQDRDAEHLDLPATESAEQPQEQVPGPPKPVVAFTSSLEPERLVPLPARNHAATQASAYDVAVSSVSKSSRSLALGRALRALKQMTPSRDRFTLDEVATAERIADTKLRMPVLTPTMERRYDIALVVDDAPSMWIWHDSIVEFAHLLAGHGTFRNVRTWCLSTDAARGRMRIYPSLGRLSARGFARSIQELRDPTGRRIILVMSDCVAPAWSSGAIAEALNSWASASPVSIIQVLPNRFWQRTTLGFSPAVQIRGKTVAAQRTGLVVEHENWLFDDEKGRPIPVVTMEPALMQTWARLIAGSTEHPVPGFILRTDSVGKGYREAFQKQGKATDDRLTAAERVTRFRQASSAPARRLAELLAAAPLNLSFMHLVQMSMVPDSQKEHLAEVVLGGLMQRVDPKDGVREPDDVQYEFIDGVREHLLEGLSVPRAVQVLGRISAFINERASQPLEFQALLTDPTGTANESIATHHPAFAAVAANVLRRMGGIYSTLAHRIQQQLTSAASISPQVIDLELRDPVSQQNIYDISTSQATAYDIVPTPLPQQEFHTVYQQDTYGPLPITEAPLYSITDTYSQPNIRPTVVTTVEIHETTRKTFFSRERINKLTKISPMLSREQINKLTKISPMLIGSAPILSRSEPSTLSRSERTIYLPMDNIPFR